MSAAHTAVLGKADPAVRKELPRFNLISGGLNQLAKLPALLFSDGYPQILNLRCVLAHEDNQSNIRNASHPGITNQLGIECQKTLRLFRIAAGRRFPVDDAFRPIQLTDRIEVREELAPGGKRARQFHLQILLWMLDPNTIILGEPLEQLDALVIEPVPAVVLRIGQGGVLVFAPFLEEGGS